MIRLTVNSTTMPILILFFGLQACDAATTLAFLRHGVSEGNPLIAALMVMALSPAVALAIAKLGGCALGIYAWKSNRTRLLRRANVFFAVCVAWNLAAILEA